MNNAKFHSELVAQDQHLKTIRESLHKVLGEVDAAIENNHKLMFVLRDAMSPKFSVAQPTELDKVAVLAEKLKEAGGVDYEHLTNSKLDPDAIYPGIMTSAEMSCFLSPKGGTADAQIIAISNDEIIFFTQDSAFGDLHSPEGMVNATYLPGFTRKVHLLKFVDGKLVNHVKLADPDNPKVGIESVEDLAHYLIKKNIVLTEVVQPLVPTL